jgi:phosphohistidine phosphatase
MLFRHGKAAAKSGIAGGDDMARPLADKGKRGAQRMGVWLWQKGIRPDYILSSPAERAITSAHKLCKAMGKDPSLIKYEKRLYAADVKTLLSVLSDCPKKHKRIMLVGHNPGLADLLSYLLGGQIPQPEDGKLLPTASLARLVLPDNWKKLEYGCARLKVLTRPDDLPAWFPFPAPDGKEKRDRPAYYYRQSAVIPYRVRDKSIDVMLIGSSKRNHWVVPKGIHEPGMSAQDSAAQEAFEEAGIKGKVSESKIGTYEYDKWGSTCKVEVYAMQVSEILPEYEWEESHRGRKWMSTVEAAALVKEPSLRPMIKSLYAIIDRIS